MRTYKYKLQNHPRLSHVVKDLLILGEIWNHFIALCRRHYRIYGKYPDYKRANYERLSSHLTKLKKLEKYSHWRKPYSWCVQNVLRRIDLAYISFFKGIAKRPPRFRRRVLYSSQTFDGKQCPFELVADKKRGKRRVPVAKVRISGKWYKFWYSRPILGKVIRVTVKKDRVGDFFITFTTDFAGVKPEPKTGKAAGFDFGVRTLLTCSDGSKKESPEFYKQNAKKVVRANRNLSRKNRGSKNRERARMEYARTHRKIERQRCDHHWNLALELVREFDWLFFEDLNLQGMKRLWGRKVSDIAFGELMQKIEWQAKKRVKEVFKIDRWEPTTSVCHVCDYKVELDLSDREWTCDWCNTHHDRDVNAAKNILKIGLTNFFSEGIIKA